MDNKKFDLQDRLIDYSVKVIKLLSFIKNDVAGSHLTGQLVRSGTSPALNYGEAQSSESRKDFIHKMKICLKELRETYINIEIIKRATLHSSDEKINEILEETNQLISIFVKSIDTANKNSNK